MERSDFQPCDGLADAIAERANASSSPFVVAIDGRSGTGKTTLATELCTRLDAVVLPGDDFFAGGTATRNDPADVLAEECIRWRDVGVALRAIRDDGRAEYHAFDWDAFDGSKKERPTVVLSRPIILFEGVYSARPQLEHLVDFAVLLELPEAERLRRLRQREGVLTEWELQWQKAEHWYFSQVVRTDRFDAVVSNGTVRFKPPPVLP